MADFRDIMKNNQAKLNQLTKCNDYLIDVCIGKEILTTFEGDDIRDITNDRYKRSAKFYASLRNDRRAFETLLEIFKDPETGQCDDVIEILSKCLFGDNVEISTATVQVATDAYVLEGTNSQMKTFNPEISYLACTSIQLTHVTIESKELIKCLTNCTNLKDLILNQVTLSGDFKGRRVTLPKLEKFILDLIPASNIELLLAPTGCSYLDKNGFKTIMFFDKSEKQWNPEEISDLNVNIEFSIGGVKNFILDHEECYISSRLEFSEEILTHVRNFKIKKLALRKCDVDLSNKNICLDGLISLNLNNVVTLPDLATCLQNCPNLTNLSVWRNPQTSILRLSDLPEKLTHLTIAQINIDYTPEVTFKHMELIYLDRCRLDDNVLSNFSTIFNSQRVSINPYVLECGAHDSRQMQPLLKNILQNNGTSWIRMWMQRYFKSGCEPEFYEEVEQFLDTLNLGKRDKRFILKRGDRGWLRETLTQRGREQCYFHFYGGQEFWKSFSHYNNEN